MTNITDEYMQQMLTLTKSYTSVLLKATSKIAEPGSDKIIWEHARRNFALRADGLLSIVFPVTDGGELAGISIFNAEAEEVMAIMQEDPGVKAGIFTFEVHPCKSFPGDTLPE